MFVHIVFYNSSNVGLITFTGACGILVGHPLDTIKTWQQFSNHKIRASVYNIIVRHNGVSPADQM